MYTAGAVRRIGLDAAPRSDEQPTTIESPGRMTGLSFVLMSFDASAVT